MRTIGLFVVFGCLAPYAWAFADEAVLAAPLLQAPQWRRTVDGWEDAAYWQTQAPKHTDGAPLEGAIFLASLCAVVLLLAEGTARRAPAPSAGSLPDSGRPTATRPVLARE